MRTSTEGSGCAPDACGLSESSTQTDISKVTDTRHDADARTIAAATSDDGGAAQEVMTVEEAAAFLRVNVKSLYEAINRAEIPCQTIGKVRRLYRPALVAWFMQGQDREVRTSEKPR